VEILDTSERLSGAQVLIFNLPEYGAGLPVPREATPADGLLNLCVFQQPTLADTARYALACFGLPYGQIPPHEHRLVKRVRLTATAPVALQIDGDPAGLLPVTIAVVPRVIQLVVPSRKHGVKPLSGLWRGDALSKSNNPGTNPGLLSSDFAPRIDT
jgi:diacylglycerol kinase family enzyme